MRAADLAAEAANKQSPVAPPVKQTPAAPAERPLLPMPAEREPGQDDDGPPLPTDEEIESMRRGS
jgi:hypothetical protein